MTSTPELLWRGKCRCAGNRYEITAVIIDGVTHVDHHGTPCRRFAKWPTWAFLRWVRTGAEAA